MGQQLINVGTVANDGTGDTARAGAIKINENMTELYNSALSMSEAEIDVGATPVADASINVTNTEVTATSRIIGGIAYSAPTDKDLDELDMDSFDIKFEALAGSFNVKIKGLEGYIADKFKIWYIYK